MQHRRRWNLSGIFRDIAKELSIPEEDPEELVQIAGLDPDEIEFYSSWWFFGKFGEYLRGRKKTDAEKMLFVAFLVFLRLEVNNMSIYCDWLDGECFHSGNCDNCKAKIDAAAFDILDYFYYSPEEFKNLPVGDLLPMSSSKFMNVWLK